MKARSLAAVVALIASTAPATAAECALERAVYAGDHGFEIRFLPLDPHALSTTNVFELVLPNGQRLTGEVIWGNGESRPIGVLRHGCVPDETDYDRLEACTHWEGIVYGIDEGTVSLLSGGEHPAPEQIVLANLGQKLRYSLAFTDLKFPEVPWDVFKFKSCQT